MKNDDVLFDIFTTMVKNSIECDISQTHCTYSISDNY